MLTTDEIKRLAADVKQALRDQAQYEYDKERRGTGLSNLLDEAADTILLLLQELGKDSENAEA